MSSKDDIEKVDAWFGIINRRIITPIKETDIKKSCTATLALLFAAVDGLGKLTCNKKDYKKSGPRFKSFLRRMGEDYERNADALWEIRNGIDHSGVNLESYMFATSEGNFEFEHLGEDELNGFLYIDTTKFFDHFCEASRRLREEMNENNQLLKLAADRLKWAEVKSSECIEDETPSPSPPPPVEFIHLS